MREFKVGDRIYSDNHKTYIGTISRIEDNQYYCCDWISRETGIQSFGKAELPTSHPVLAIPEINEEKLRKVLAINKKD